MTVLIIFIFLWCDSENAMSHQQPIIHILGAGILMLDSCRAAWHNWQNSKVCRSSWICASHSLSSLYFLHSLKTVCVALHLSPFSSSTHPRTLLHSQPLSWQKINTARKLIKCNLQLVLLTLQHDKSSSLVINPLVEEVNKSTQNKSARNRNAINLCLVLASLGKFNKVNCPSFPWKKKKKHLIGVILYRSWEQPHWLLSFFIFILKSRK